MQTLRRAVAGGAGGSVLEIGAGTGAGFPHYSAAERVIAAEPDPFMLRRARQPAQEAPVPVILIRALAEALPLADASVDTALCALVLCTVQDPDQAVAEVRRVLKPGGTLRFLEHVRGDGLLGLTHDAIAPAWRHFVGGCNPNRRTEGVIGGDGLEIVELRQESLGLGLPAIRGVARRL
jgi:ubiquinone/menaquinone biosynthesis C-methylase UbiE